MVARAELTRIRDPPYLAKAATSYDRESKVNDPADGLYVEKNGRDWGKGWFANRDFNHSIRMETASGRTEHVLMDDHHAPGEEELYDLSKDPDEHHNLAMDSACSETLDRFRSQHPKEFAPQAMGIKARNLRPRFTGETFEWHPWDGRKSVKK